MIDPAKKILPFLSRKRRSQLIWLIIFSILSAVAEGFAIASILPFINIMVGESNFFGLKIFDISNVIGNEDKLIITTFFLLTVLIATSFRIVYIWISNLYCYGLGAELSTIMFSNLINAPYRTQKMTNLSSALSTLTTKSGALISGLIQPIINIISNTVTGIAIVGTLVLINPNAVLWAGLILTISYLIIAMVVKKKMKDFGKKIAYTTTNNVKIIQDNLNLYKDIKLQQTEMVTIKNYENNILLYQISCAKVQIAILLPKQLIEALAVCVMATLVFLLIESGSNLAGSIGLIGALALGAQRTLPMVQQLYANVMTIKSMEQNVSDSIKYLEIPRHQTQYKKIKVDNNLKINYEKINYRFPDAIKNTITEVNLIVKIGDCVGITGKTGSGKSTLIDIIMGMLPPVEGKIIVNGEKLSKDDLGCIASLCALVPQQIYLKNASIKENIILNNKNINELQITNAIKAAGLTELISKLPNGLNTIVGERAAILSGGQIQRVGIARALYLERPILILDEATNALDKETEAIVLKNIFDMRSTKIIYIISHDKENFSQCNKFINLDE